ncbi:carbohydrate ABC transporter permease [Candidatus Allofournierella merdipullorum]|uniref:carbohydrate ABC transporter permease n=1 Tax=Candidatus Allofournierella merdipullorum TaxID=2838595 RepID=UPI002A884B51|nr:sugar ABC transporter permease [Candidatus Fournierella merdipullorum]
MKKKKRAGRRLSFSQQRALCGFLFCLPFVAGFLLLFLAPMIQSIRYAFSTIQLGQTGMTLNFVGLKNFRAALFADPEYVRTIAESVGSMVLQVPVILVFSLFISLLLNQKFRGRTLARAIFFLPVIVVSGIILEILSTDYLSTAIMSGEETIGAFRGMESHDILVAMGIPQQLIDLMIPVVYDIFNLVWSSGVQILMFLAGLQTIPSSLYECAKLEGATGWEMFWKITFPLISPMLLMNVVYSVVDFFTTSANPVIRMINQQTGNMRFEYAAGLSWMYLLVVLVLLGIVYKLMSKHIVYLGE